MPVLRFIAVMLLAACSALPLSLRAAATPLDKQACANLKLEQKKLLTREIQEALVRGPDWVKAHLDSEKIERVREYLTVEESLMFRCRGGGIVLPPPPPLPDRKPPVPVISAEAADTAATITTADTGTPFPDRKPVLNAAIETKPSQTLADSDKTARSETKATP